MTQKPITQNVEHVLKEDIKNLEKLLKIVKNKDDRENILHKIEVLNGKLDFSHLENGCD